MIINVSMKLSNKHKRDSVKSTVDLKIKFYSFAFNLKCHLITRLIPYSHSLNNIFE